ncbi:SSPO protein, partial [Orthonyx spaldingii]|nr:SSPO protein [Orthonyx spaldingii]
QERGRWRVPGERWRGGPCRVCQCLPGGGVRCVPYCPLRGTGCPQVSAGRGAGRGEPRVAVTVTLPCPQGQVLREGDGGSCCTCGPAGDNAPAAPPGMVTALSPPAPAKGPGSLGYERGKVEHRGLGVPKAGGPWGRPPLTAPPSLPPP